MLTIFYILLTSSFLMVITGIFLFYKSYQVSSFNKDAIKFCSLINEGLITFSKRVFSSIIQIILYTTIILFFFSIIFKKSFLWQQIGAFSMGGLFICVISFVILYLAPSFIPKILEKSNTYLYRAVLFQYQISSALSFFIIGLTITGLLLSYLIFGASSIIGYGVGIILSSFFLRIGGGLFKSGAQLSVQSHLETSDISAFDKRNPALLLDLVGDYICRIVGFNSDILGSFIFSLISCFLFSFSFFDNSSYSQSESLIFFNVPLYIILISLFTSFIVYIYTTIRIKFRKTQNILLESLYLAILISSITTYLAFEYLNMSQTVINIFGQTALFQPFYYYLFGLLGAILIAFTSEYLTSNNYKPTKRLARQIEHGVPVTVLNSFVIGLKSNSFYLIYLLLIILPSLYFGGFYGVTIASLGMLSLSTTIMVLQIFNSFVSVTYKVSELTLDENLDGKSTILHNIKQLNYLGQTAISLGNGFAAGAASISTISIFFSLILMANINSNILILMNLKWYCGLIIGIMIPCIFSGLLLKKLNELFLFTSQEVYRQIKGIAFLIENKAHPDIILATDQHSRFCMDALIIPGIIMSLPPIIIGYMFGPTFLIGIVLGVFLTGINQNFYWANLGDVLGNAKLYIEKGHFGGYNSNNYTTIDTASRIGNTFKDLLGPSINIFIKSVIIISFLVMILTT
ncbi:hypothetical protein DID75_02315 [Candidatus Marinamargulisbacteria bacterium SCGC AG-410-N11]|nr:hypothetical protein DID75_02315 [Candidatus Marinamargulisbacteria bacterium SCGC AG-410-N11]